MAHMPDHDEQGRGHRVRPRWVWAALAVMILGAAVIGWGVVVTSWTWAIGGIVVLFLGTVAAGYAGLFYDIHSSAGARAEIHDVVHGESHLGPDPRARVDDDKARDAARRAAEGLRRRQAATAASKPRLFGRRHGAR